MYSHQLLVVVKRNVRALCAAGGTGSSAEGECFPTFLIMSDPTVAQARPGQFVLL